MSIREGAHTLTQLTDGATFNYPLHGYLASNGYLLLLSNDSSDTFIGQGFPRRLNQLA